MLLMVFRLDTGLMSHGEIGKVMRFRLSRILGMTGKKELLVNLRLLKVVFPLENGQTKTGDGKDMRLHFRISIMTGKLESLENSKLSKVVFPQENGLTKTGDGKATRLHSRTSVMTGKLVSLASLMPLKEEFPPENGLIKTGGGKDTKTFKTFHGNQKISLNTKQILLPFKVPKNLHGSLKPTSKYGNPAQLTPFKTTSQAPLPVDGPSLTGLVHKQHLCFNELSIYQICNFNTFITLTQFLIC